jgi:hypothetical protein
MRRTLVLKRETLTEITPHELAGIAGAQAITPACPTVDRCPTDHCVSIDYTCLVSQYLDPCLSHPCGSR